MKNHKARRGLRGLRGVGGGLTLALGSALAAALAVGAWLAPRAASAHGINGHVHVTGWAIEGLPADSPLARFFAERGLFDAALIGAAFPDAGYAIDDPFGELAHWEPFIEAWVEFVRDRYGPDYASPEARQQLAFLMGAAAHGLQDELFDSLFLFQLMERDGAGQDEADPGTDAFLHIDGHARFRPPLWLPEADLVEVFRLAHGHAVAPATLRNGLNRVKTLVIDSMHLLAPEFDARYRPLMPWGSQHYLDPAVPGSLASEVPPTAAYLQALWQRLHGERPVVVTHGWPEPHRRLRSNGPDTVDAWITLVFGVGAQVASLDAQNVVLLDPEGAPAPVRVQHSRWTGQPDDATRLVRVQPTAALRPDTIYTLRVGPGVALQDGTVTEEVWTFAVRTACADPAAEGCADPPDAPFPPPPPTDAGSADGGSADGGPADGGAEDAAPEDVGGEDVGAGDVGADRGLGDGGLADRGSADAHRPSLDRGVLADGTAADLAGPSVQDAAPDAARSGRAEPGGCSQASGAQASGAPARSGGGLWALGLLGFFGLRRRPRRTRA